MTKPIIVIEFTSPTECKWWSAGWKDNSKLMAKAKKAINQGDYPEEVIKLLDEAGFDVVEDLENAPVELLLDK